MKLIAQHPERFRLFQRTQILALQVFDDRHLRRLLQRYPPHHRRNVGLPRLLRSMQPPLTQDQDVAPSLRPTGRTMIGCTTPFALIESANSSSFSSSSTYRV